MNTKDIPNSDRPSQSADQSSTKELPAQIAVEEACDISIHDGDFKKRQEFGGWTLAWLAYQSIGVIYGDIGTSPLYVYSSTFTSEPSRDDLLGALSLIIWTLTLMVSIKYVMIVLLADDEGEGGTFALYSLLSRYAHILDRDPKEASMVKMMRFESKDLGYSVKSVRSAIERSKFAKITLKFVGVVGVSLVMADGVLTPAQSVLGAVQGLRVASPGVSTETIVGVSCAILVLLFIIQPLGTTKIAGSFAPIVIVWLLFNFAFGIYNLIMYDHTVLKAFSPYFAGAYLVRNKTDGWKSLGGILLAFTGVEALFANLGAFSRRAIQWSWLFFAFPCLLIAYIGQAAHLYDIPSAYTNPFFSTVPPGMLYPGLVISVLAAIVASQALITSTFQLLSQCMELSYFPQIKLVHTSSKFYGQVYIPMANWLLMIGTVIVTAVYQNTTALGLAYGVCVIMVTFITTCMVAIVALLVWRLNIILVIVAFVVFAALDGVYLSSALTKIPDGAWFTLVLGGVLSGILILWRYGKEQQWKAEAGDRIWPSQFVSKYADGGLRLSPAFGGAEVTEIKGIGIFFDKSGWKTPTVYQQFLRKFEAQPAIVVFLHMRPLNAPTVSLDERYAVTRAIPTMPACFRVIIRHGYNDIIVNADLARVVFEQVQHFIGRDFSRQIEAEAVVHAQDKLREKLTTELEHLKTAYDTQVVYIVGKEQMRIQPENSFFRKVALAAFLWLRENTRSRIASMRIPVDKLVEVGFIKEL